MKAKDSNKSRAASKAAALAKLLGAVKRDPLSLNPSEKGQFRKTAAEHHMAVVQGLRKRRNDILFNLLTSAASPMGTSR